MPRTGESDDGQWGYLDHALGSDTLTTQVAGVEDWHINVDEPSVLDYNTNFKSAGQVTSLYAPDQFRDLRRRPSGRRPQPRQRSPRHGCADDRWPDAGGTAVSLSTSFTDADRIDTHTATIDWGDGTASTAGVVTEAAGAGTVTSSHVYAAAGLYPVTVSLSDGYNTVTSSTRAVVFDPTAGFLTGGGWFQSPAGALVTNPAAAGKAKIDVSVKYTTPTAPSGSFTLSLDGVRFALATTSIDWLVVSGDTGTFAGPATVNGQPGYRVEATAVDRGSSDTMKVVVRDASGTVVYDSGTQRVQGQLKLH